MRLKTGEKQYKAWKDVKAGDIICYWDKGKIHEQLVHSVEEKEDVYVYNFGNTRSETRDKYLVINAGRGSKIKIYEHYLGRPEYEDYYFTRFASKEALIDCVKQHLDKLNIKVEVARKKYERFLNISKKYDKVIKDYNAFIENLN